MYRDICFPYPYSCKLDTQSIHFLVISCHRIYTVQRTRAESSVQTKSWSLRLGSTITYIRQKDALDERAKLMIIAITYHFL